MNCQEAKVPQRISDALNYLELATIILDNIKVEARTPEVDSLIKKAADSIYEAQEFLHQIDLEQYNTRSGGFTGEHVKVFRHRKNKPK